MITKAVLPVAGFGTRFLPASKAIPKEMLPIIDKPLVQYAVEEAIDSGINEIIFIISPEKYPIKKHFKQNKDFESRLMKSGKENFVEKLNPKKFNKIKFYYVNQKDQNGLGHAVLQAEHVIGKNPFAVLLPDDLFFSQKSCLDQLKDIYLETKCSVIAVNEIDDKNIHKYGVIKSDQEMSGAIKIYDIVEKPLAENAPSNIAVCGRYIFNHSIFEHLKSTQSDKSGEIQLTDAIRSLLKDEDVYATIYEGEKFDCGSKDGYVHATISLALKDDSISEKVKKIIRDIV